MRRSTQNMSWTLHKQDISENFLNYALKKKIVACDIETSGLNWRSDKIGICQLYTPNSPVSIIKVADTVPHRMLFLLSDSSVKKVFHHAMFDLRFMTYHWGVVPQNIACTKIASKLLGEKDGKDTHLKSLLERYLNVKIAKDTRFSNWFTDELTNGQILYAAKDVMYLIPLLKVLETELQSKELLELAHKCFDHIPTRIRLDILGYDDIYSY